MILSEGSRLGPYEILARIDAGAMGEVYRAYDPRLRREVAIKVCAHGFEGRFEREARAIAALNHPNICQLHDIGPNYLVMELVEGVTLRDRLSRGALALGEALEIARQVAEALQAAHQRGIVHRDLKPANVKIKPDGGVTVLDFGIAKMTNASGPAFSIESSPTVTLPATAPGTILGTVAYMAPEQARGEPVDKRADIWSFGCVLYELLVGRRAFSGASPSDVIAAVMKSDPDWTVLPANTPPALLRLLRRCLQKDLKRRLHDMGDARLEIDEALHPELYAPVTGITSRKRPRILAGTWLLASALLVAFGAGVWWHNSRSLPVVHWTGVQLGGPTVALGPRVSPDGNMLAFQAMVEGVTQVAVMKPGSGNWLVLTHDRSRGLLDEMSWSRDGAKIYFDRFSGTPRGIFSVPVLGGEARLVLGNACGPQLLPDGSMLCARLNTARQLQLHRYWPETARLEALKAILAHWVNSPPFRISPTGKTIVFLGKRLEEPSAPDHLYAMTLDSERVVPLAPQYPISTTLGTFPLAFPSSGRSVFCSVASGDLHYIISVPTDGSDDVRPLFPLTTRAGYLDMAADGTLYADQWEHPGEVMRLSPSDGRFEHIGAVAMSDIAVALPLSDGRVVATSRIAGHDRLLVMSPGREAVPFIQTEDESAGPIGLVGQAQIAFLLGSGQDRTIALASVADGRIIRRFAGPKGSVIHSLISTPDGKTLIYAASGSVWAIPATDGQPQKLGAGDAVAFDPYEHDLIVRLAEKGGVRLARMPLAGGSARPVLLTTPKEVFAGWLHPNAVAKDGSILVQVAPPSSWFWPAAIVDVQTGVLRLLRTPYQADIPSAGWTPDGKIVMIAYGLRSSLWRFRPDKLPQPSR